MLNQYLTSIVVCLLAIIHTNQVVAETTKPPNVIYILADDLGYGDLSCYGQTKFKTPHIDALAEQGMRFTQHYSGSTVCAPSRCSLLTGLHSGHAVVRGNSEVRPEGQSPMPADTFTVAHLMQSAGYQTGVFGKWGLGAPNSTSEPLKMGFDRFYGYNCQRIAHSYYPAFLWNNDEREILFGNVAQKQVEYAPDLIHAQALDFIRDNKDRPFFCYYAAVQPHADMVAPKSYMNQHRGKYGTETPYPQEYYSAQAEPRAAFVAMVHVLDDYVGDITQELEKLGIADNTLIIFTSDNGPHVEGGHDPEYFDSNGIKKGFKRDLYEGGVNVPMIATWPAKIQSGTTSDHISAFWDFLATMSDLVNKPLPVQTDGVSMLPTFTGKGEQAKHDYLYWEFPVKGGRMAIRRGDWKAVRYNIHKNPTSTIELYNLANDPSEAENVAANYPQIAAEMDALLKQSRTPSLNPKFEFPSVNKQ